MTDQRMPIRDQREKEEKPTRPPLPPFTRETAIQKVRAAEDAWNLRDPEKVALAYTPDSRWRSRAGFPTGRTEIVQFLKRKWAKELDYRLIKELWFTMKTEFLCVSRMSGTMTLEVGSAPTGTRTGSLMIETKYRLGSFAIKRSKHK
jgi:hypothetical protein